jgi:hypothetical protein
MDVPASCSRASPLRMDSTLMQRHGVVLVKAGIDVLQSCRSIPGCGVFLCVSDLQVPYYSLVPSHEQQKSPLELFFNSSPSLLALIFSVMRTRPCQFKRFECTSGLSFNDGFSRCECFNDDSMESHQTLRPFAQPAVLPFDPSLPRRFPTKWVATTLSQSCV